MCGPLYRFLKVGHFIKMVMDLFTKIDDGVLLYLYGSVCIQFYAGVVHNTQITDVILTFFTDNHQLRLPKFLIIRDLVVVSFTLTNFK